MHGSHGEENISDMWRNHFEQLYNSVENKGARTVFNDRLLACSEVKNAVSFTINDVTDAMRKQKLGKAIGPDGIAIEALFIYLLFESDHKDPYTN